MSQHEEDQAHLRLRELLGPYVLGGIEADDRTQLEIHLSTCTSCEDELATYASLPTLLRAGAPEAENGGSFNTALEERSGSCESAVDVVGCSSALSPHSFWSRAQVLAPR